jgi:hypothetical protein
MYTFITKVEFSDQKCVYQSKIIRQKLKSRVSKSKTRTNLNEPITLLWTHVVSKCSFLYLYMMEYLRIYSLFLTPLYRTIITFLRILGNLLTVL